MHEALVRDGVVTHEKGYIRVSAGPYRNQYLHILIWKWWHPGEYFNPKIHNIHHRDGDKRNFHPDNLERVNAKDHPHVTALAGRAPARDQFGRFVKRVPKPKPAACGDDEAPF